MLPVLVAGLFGLFNGWLITRFRIQPIVATLVLFIAGRGIAQVMTNGNLQVFKNPEFQFIGLGRVFGVPVQVVIMVVIVAAAAWVLRRTAVRPADPRGRRQRGARRGWPAFRSPASSAWVYAISGLCAGIAGLIVVARNSSSDANLVGLGMELDAIAAVAVGGTLVHRRAGDRRRHADRRADHPARALHAARQRRARCRGAGGQGRDHRRWRSGCSGTEAGMTHAIATHGSGACAGRLRRAAAC